MSTKNQLKKMFSAVLAAHPHARYVDGRIYLRPISQVAWVIVLGTTSIPEIYHLDWGPSAMFIPGRYLSGLKFRIILAPPRHPQAEGIEERVRQAVEEQCLRHIPQNPTLDDLYTSLAEPGREHYFDYFPSSGAFYHAANGNIRGALEMSHRSCLATKNEPLEKMPLHTRVLMRDLHPLLLAGDRKGIGALLRHHEQRCALAHKVEKFWEPAPYPVELLA